MKEMIVFHCKTTLRSEIEVETARITWLISSPSPLKSTPLFSDVRFPGEPRSAARFFVSPIFDREGELLGDQKQESPKEVSQEYASSPNMYFFLLRGCVKLARLRPVCGIYANSYRGGLQRGPRLRESHLLAPSGREREFTQPRVHLGEW